MNKIGNELNIYLTQGTEKDGIGVGLTIDKPITVKDLKRKLMETLTLIEETLDENDIDWNTKFNVSFMVDVQ